MADVNKIAKEITAKWIQRQRELQRHRPITPEQQRFMGRLQHELRLVNRYEDWDLQEKAREVIPVDRLHEEARKLQPSSSGLSFEDLIIKRLLRWFKDEFFKWVNSPLCSSCNGETKAVGYSQPNAFELRYGAGRVELYVCKNCNSQNRFPRFNDPAILLETPHRRGRCGEWANAFTLLCRAMGYETRLVLDWTDHVWTEYFSDHLNRWVHLDSCEAAFDTPLVYEVGWGKKLSYVFAFSADEIIDVSKRYTRDYFELLKRRSAVPEVWLDDALEALNTRIGSGLNQQRASYIKARREEELAAMEKSWRNDVKSEELVGRQSGSLEWRTQRGETGHLQQAPAALVAIVQSSTTELRDFNAAEWALNGTAVATSDMLLLTPDRNDCRASAWYRAQFDTTRDFVAEFSFRIISRDQGADGFAFVIQRDVRSVDAIGEGGAGLGYSGISHSVAVEFDTYASVDRCEDPSDNHISVHTRGVMQNSSHHLYSLGCNTNLPRLSNGSIYFVSVVYFTSEETLCVFLSDSSEKKTFVPTVTVNNLNLQDTVGGKIAYFGFTASTGGLSQRHEVLKFSFIQQ